MTTLHKSYLNPEATIQLFVGLGLNYRGEADDSFNDGFNMTYVVFA